MENTLLFCPHRKKKLFCVSGCVFFSQSSFKSFRFFLLLRFYVSSIWGKWKGKCPSFYPCRKGPSPFSLRVPLSVFWLSVRILSKFRSFVLLCDLFVSLHIVSHFCLRKVISCKRQFDINEHCICNMARTLAQFYESKSWTCQSSFVPIRFTCKGFESVVGLDFSFCRVKIIQSCLHNWKTMCQFFVDFFLGGGVGIVKVLLHCGDRNVLEFSRNCTASKKKCSKCAGLTGCSGALYSHT